MYNSYCLKRWNWFEIIVIPGEAVGAGHEPGQGAAGRGRKGVEVQLFFPGIFGRMWTGNGLWMNDGDGFVATVLVDSVSVFADTALSLSCTWISVAQWLNGAVACTCLTRGLWTFSLATDPLLVSSNHLTHRDCRRHATWLQYAWANTDRIIGY